ncbi:MAG: hypothetical protein JST80_10350 [Bdellovibrionales bacterium]|nr:hypothetical protein [Bdellovibrionales bacterium]
MSKFLLGFSVIFGMASTASAQAETLWDNWYTVTEKGKPQSYYHEKAELVGTKAKIQVNSWIREGSKTRSENLGATAKNTTLLEPLLYNFRTQDERGMEKIIDGSIVSNGKVFSVKIKKGAETLKPLRAEMIPKLILSSFFPVWVNKNYKRITGVQPIEFHAIVEDQVDDQVPVVAGTAYEMNPDDISKKYSARKIRVVFSNTVNYWYIDKQGAAIRIDIPSQEKHVEKVDKATAEAFLSKL